MISERPRDAAIRTLPIITFDHSHVVVRVEVVLHVQAIPPAEDLVTNGTVLRVHAPSMKTVFEGRERGVLQAEQPEKWRYPRRRYYREQC